MTYCTNKLYGLMFARELATRLKVCLHPSCIFYHFYITKSVQPSWRFHQKLHEKWAVKDSTLCGYQYACINHFHSVELRFYNPQTFLYPDFWCRDDVSDLE